MIIPVRCYTCSKVIGHLWDEYQEKVQKGYETEVSPLKNNRLLKSKDMIYETCEKKTLDELGIKRYCCRRMFITHVDLSEKIC